MGYPFPFEMRWFFHFRPRVDWRVNISESGSSG